MKRLFIIASFILSSSILYSQMNTSSIFVGLGYPIPVGNNFLNNSILNGNGYDGIVSIGVDYNIFQSSKFGIGLLFNSSFLRLPETDVDLCILRPKIKAELFVSQGKVRVIPGIAVGFSYLTFKVPSIIEGEFEKEKQKGLSLEGRTKFVFYNDKRLNWYFLFVYEFTRLEKPEIAENSEYNRNLQLIYPGIGVIIKFK